MYKQSDCLFVLPLMGTVTSVNIKINKYAIPFHYLIIILSSFHLSNENVVVDRQKQANV
jgi:hypothetical protein